MIRLLRGTLARLFALGLLALVLLAILISAARLALPLLDQYRDQVAAVLSERLGYPLRMGGMSVHFGGWSPRLALDDVVLSDPDGGPDLLSLRALELALDLPASLRLGSPQIRTLTLVGARLALRRLPDGRIRILGLGALQSDDPRTLELFLRQGRLSLVDSEVSLTDDRLPGWVLRLSEVRLGVTNEGQVHRLALWARPVPDAPADRAWISSPGDARLRLLADLRGEGTEPGTWGGRLYLELRGADTLALLPPLWLEPGKARAEALGLEVWLRLGDGRLDEALGRVSLEGLGLTPPRIPAVPARESGAVTGAPGPATLLSAPEEVLIDRLDAVARVARGGGGWEVGIRDLGLAILGSEATGVGLDLSLSPQGLLSGLRVAADHGDLALVGSLRRFPAGPLTQALQRLAALEPNGRLERIAFVHSPLEDGGPRWRLAAQGSGVGIARSGEVPGFCGLSFGLRADQRGGDLHLHSDWLHLDLAPLFDRALYLDRFSGVLGWRVDPHGGLRLTGRNLTLENPDLKGQGRFNLDLPAQSAASGAPSRSGPFIDLRASLHGGNGARARTYLPVGIMHPKLVRWLEQALVGGRIPQADLVLRGPLGDFPFREHQGRFEVLAQIQDAGLDYREGWPPLESARGTLRFLNQEMEIRIDSARILDSALTQGLARLPDLRGARRLSIHAEAEAPLADGLRVLGETPLAERLGPVARRLEVSGGSSLTLDLEVPLARGEPLGLAGHLTWPGPAGLTLKGTPLVLEDLAGELRFTRDSLSAQSTRARLWGQPLDLTLETRQSADPDGALTQIRAGARLPVSVLAERLPSPAWALAAGEAHWDLELDLRHADLRLPDSPIRWRLGSDLRGLALDLPAPLGKTADQASPLALEGILRPGRALDLRGRVGVLGLDLLVGLGPESPQLEGGRVVLGAGPPPESGSRDRAGLRAEGTLETLDLAAWGAWWSRLGGEQGGLVPLGQPDAILGPRSLDLEVGRLDLGARALTEARIQAALDAGTGRVRLDSRELAGELIPAAPGTGSPLQINLTRVDLASLVEPSDAGGPPPAAPASRFSVATLPPSDVRVADLRWAESSLGRLSLDLRPEPSGLGVRRIELQGPGDTQVEGDAAWADGPDGGRSWLSLALRSGDTGPLMRALDYRSVLSEAPLESRLRLDWAGGLESFSLARSTGTVDLKVGAGRLLEVEPGVGRVLGILNLGALSRRLALDFKDLFQQGFSFEQILGEVSIGSGRAELRQLSIEGPSSTIRVSGFTDLRSRTFDQTVTVEPRIGSSVALASALAGGPVVGAAVYLADKVTGGAIDKLGAYRYRVTGPWADPQLTRLGWDPFASGAGLGPLGESEQAGPASTSRPPQPAGRSHFLD